MIRIVSSAAFVALAGLLLSGPAAARIRCIDDFQLQRDGSQIQTPYCQEENLAKVAREHGLDVTPNAIRQNWGLYLDVCRRIGNDIRVMQTCQIAIPPHTRCRVLPCF